MTNLADRQTIINILQSHGMHTQKRFGQHFLIDDSVLQNIVAAANIQPEDIVIEVGAGIGVLTQELAQRAQKVISFEIDAKLQSVLAETLSGFSNIELHLEDFLKTNFQLPTTGYKLVANLPYNAGSHILGQLLKSPQPPQSITVLLQNEVAQKITAQPPHATYMSNFFQTYGQAAIIQTISPNSFFPPPKVDSAILQVVKQYQLTEISPQSFSHFLHRGFANPRKMLNKAFPADQLAAAHIDANLRPENLTFDQWAVLYKSQHKNTKV